MNELIDAFYEPLYRFALSLAKCEASACDLTQETFYRWAAKGHTLRDSSKAKSWLFTTLYREFLQTKRRAQRWPEESYDESLHASSAEEPESLPTEDAQAVHAALFKVDEIYRIPLTLFYLEELSYKEIAEVLAVPAGTVMSRLSRGKQQLRHHLLHPAPIAAVIPFPVAATNTLSFKTP
jgi:RNA polymerase sigma-70 factor, ECF subfamily